jgi:hypothetical protein
VLCGGRDRDRTCDFCRVKSRMADSVRLVTGVSPGRSWNFASRSGPLMTAVVRWSMPQLCPKITSLPAQSPYILFKRSRAASCGSGSSEPSSGSCFVANCQQPAQQPALPQGIALAARPFWRWPVSGPRLPRWPTAWPPAAVRQHISPGGALGAFPPQVLPFSYQRNKLSKPVLDQRTAVGGGVSQLTRCRPRASLDWIPGSTTPQRWNTTACTALPMPSAPC